MQVTLINGSIHEQHEVASILSALETLKREHALIFIALVNFVRTPGHYLSRNACRELRNSGLLTSNNWVPKLVRDVVVSAVLHRTKYDYELVSPYAPVLLSLIDADVEAEADTDEFNDYNPDGDDGENEWDDDFTEMSE